MADTDPPDLEFTHTRLLVSAFSECFHFYRDVLGFEVTFGDSEEGYADFQTGETTLALFDRSAMDEAAGNETTHDADEPDAVSLIFRVDSVDDTFGRLSADVDVVTGPIDRPEWGIRTAHFRDPDGTLIEINQPLEQA